MYELAKNPEYQEQVRQEIATKLTAGEPSFSDLDGLIYLNAFMKVCTSSHAKDFYQPALQEVLRVYAGLPISERQATRDTVLPLSQPIITTTGESINEIPIEKGQHIAVAISAYNK